MSEPFIREAFDPRSFAGWPESISDARAIVSDGWTRVSPVDSAGRRAIWCRAVFNDRDELLAIELRAGREGDDAYAVIHRSAPCFGQLANIFAYAGEVG